LAATQRFTLANVGWEPVHNRRTSVSHAARIDGVTSGGNFSSSARATETDKRRAHSAMLEIFIITPLLH
jgi:hypothetical protein